MRVLLFRQHARPEGHVAKIPSGRERIWIPRMSPDVANAVARTALDTPSRIPRPSPLSYGVVTQSDFPSLPRAAVAPVTLRIVLTAEASPVRVEGRILPDLIRVDEVGVLERSLDNGCAAFVQIALQRLHRRTDTTVVNLDSRQRATPDALYVSRLRQRVVPRSRRQLARKPMPSETRRAPPIRAGWPRAFGHGTELPVLQCHRPRGAERTHLYRHDRTLTSRQFDRNPCPYAAIPALRSACVITTLPNGRGVAGLGLDETHSVDGAVPSGSSSIRFHTVYPCRAPDTSGSSRPYWPQLNTWKCP